MRRKSVAGDAVESRIRLPAYGRGSSFHVGVAKRSLKEPSCWPSVHQGVL